MAASLSRGASKGRGGKGAACPTTSPSLFALSKAFPPVQVLPGLAGEGRAGFVFLDHCKPCYLPDLKVCVYLHVARVRAQLRIHI